MPNFFRALTIAAAVLTLLPGCSPGEPERALTYSQQAREGTVPVYRFAVHPLHSPHKLLQTYQPLIDYLNAHLINAHLEVEASKDYGAFEAKVSASEPAFLLPNPVQTLLARQKGYEVMAMAGDASDFKGIFIVRKDSGIRQPQDLKGKTVSYPSPTALAAAIMPQYYLHQQGIDVQRDVKNAYVGSQESSILNAYLGTSAAAATWPPPWRMFQKDNPAEAAQMMQIWETPPLINNSVMAHASVPLPVRQQVKALLLGLKKVPEGVAILEHLETAAFYPADNQSYDVVQQYLQTFEQTVRPVQLQLN
ncbi:PhnD/SsuA/transferrin family substrate-binding protein [Rhodoferax mekongensis]|uniref:PhnD/SsuA/transferrin family substrate-binding protein n=1 Tax=Rhodoferax mekongensis TaxID=3068341 RepID=A0ABZ0AU87_9BURK|nr:PhnD/SsuA/transferrin family substrate-binding protein [Rhodoferax sp. TBRC 17307]WNO03216.1 PhnD/SsuA/transferrin family substrate-binding protein [Rhodoferax sp. TBRC 17307]